ncbi:MAG TPA: HlyD family efflux transporter periplasmic adaptor subunit, partial [Gemmatimonadales bacterium]|nr:HlyD family efflux transporter periplasmic adaptor subunit [Gemmatimonadales bacterium]
KAFDRWLPRLRFFFSPAFLVLSVVLFAVYAIIVAAKWTEFRTGIASFYTPSDYTLGKVVVVWGTLFVIIGIHEIGHGMTCKYFGGHVHEMGAMLIYFEPAFYCNVNDAWTFPDLSARLWVTAAGSWIQLVIAAIGAIVWWAATPGTLISEIALVAVVVGGLTTILANANPLMPLDGYYALSDWLEIPNLRQRAQAHIGWLFKTRLLRLNVPMPPSDEREQKIFLIYGLLALAYTIITLGLVAVLVSGWASRSFGTAGLIVVLAIIFLMLRHSLASGVRLLRNAAQEARVRWSGSPILRHSLIGIGIVLLLMLVIPWPITLQVPFVAAAHHVVELSAPDSGTVYAVTAREGMIAAAGAPLLQIRNVSLERSALAAARVSDSLARRTTAARARGASADAAELENQRASAGALAGALGARVRALTLRAPTAGVVTTARPEEMIGRPVDAGTVLLAVADTGATEARLTLDGAGATLVRPGADVRLILDGGQWARGTVMSVAPLAGVEGGEARVRVNGVNWRSGVAGRARVTIRRSTVAGALWWRVRTLLRTDLLL